MGKCLAVIESINNRIGRLTSWIVYPMAAFAATEVTLRYVFDSPTVWVWDVNVMLLAALSAVGAGYTLLHKGHAAVDVVAKSLSPRKRAIMDSITDLLSAVTIGIIAWNLVLTAVESVVTLEKGLNVWRPVLFPVRIAVATGFSIFFFQCVCNLLHNLALVKPKTGAAL